MHLFLTGEKRVGKSTLLGEILKAFPGSLGGFRTVRLNTFLPGQYSVHLFHPQDAQNPTAENLLFVCEQKTPDTLSRFEVLGCRALDQSKGAELLLMDELGPHEWEAAAFQRAVWSAIEADTPILGVLQKAPVPFLEAISRHPKVALLEVTEENRDTLAQRIPEFLNILTKR